jgi:hypothetical protein
VDNCVTTTLYDQCKIMKLQQLHKCNKCLLMKKKITNIIKTNMNIKLKTHTHSLRNRNKVELITPRTNYAKKTILFEGVQLFNGLPNDFKLCKDVNAFKNKLRIT